MQTHVKDVSINETKPNPRNHLFVEGQFLHHMRNSMEAKPKRSARTFLRYDTRYSHTTVTNLFGSEKNMNKMKPHTNTYTIHTQ